MHALSYIADLIFEELYTPLLDALNYFEFMTIELYQSSITLASLLASLISILFLFIIIYAPISLVYKFIKRMWP